MQKGYKSEWLEKLARDNVKVKQMKKRMCQYFQHARDQPAAPLNGLLAQAVAVKGPRAWHSLVTRRDTKMRGSRQASCSN